METIGVFGVNSFTVGVWVVLFAASSALAAALYRLNAILPAGNDSTNTAGAFAIVAHLLGIIFGMLSLVTWWTTPGFWSAFMADAGPVFGSLLAVVVVLAAPVTVGRLAARLK